MGSGPKFSETGPASTIVEARSVMKAARPLICIVKAS